MSRNIKILVAAVVVLAIGAFFLMRGGSPQILVTKKDHVAVFSKGVWAIDANGNGAWDPDDLFFGFGQEGDIPFAGKFNPNAGATVAIYHAGAFYILPAVNHKRVYTPPAVAWTSPIDLPVVGDWNGDGLIKIGGFRKGFWTLDYNGNRVWDPPADTYAAVGGGEGEVPVVGDWNGDGRAKVGVFRKGVWALDVNGNGKWDNSPADLYFSFGQEGDIPVVGDWNGDGKTKAGVYLNGAWRLDMNGNGNWDGNTIDRLAALGGLPGDIPVVGDWNGDGKTKIGVFRGGLWYIDMNGNGVWDGPEKGDAVFHVGKAGDIPLVIPCTECKKKR